MKNFVLDNKEAFDLSIELMQRAVNHYDEYGSVGCVSEQNVSVTIEDVETKRGMRVRMNVLINPDEEHHKTEEFAATRVSCLKAMNTIIAKMVGDVK